jgi:hypothetical protein
VQPLNGKPNLVLALGAVGVNAKTRQPLDILLVQSKETVCVDGSGWLAAQPSGLLRELDEGEKPISFEAHEAPHVIGWAFHAVAFLPVARIPCHKRLTFNVQRIMRRAAGA